MGDENELSELPGLAHALWQNESVLVCRKLVYKLDRKLTERESRFTETPRKWQPLEPPIQEDA
jgi:hypothetical protein